MERAEQISEDGHGELTFQAMKDHDRDSLDHKFKYEGMDWASGELFKQLVQLTSGEAITIVKSIDENDGFRAWSSLKKNYNKKTIGRMMRQLDECMYPAMQKDLKGLGAAIGEWEEKWKKMAGEQKEPRSPICGGWRHY